MEEKYQQSSSKVELLTNKVNLLGKERTGMEKKYQCLRTRFDQVTTQVNVVRSEKA